MLPRSPPAVNYVCASHILEHMLPVHAEFSYIDSRSVLTLRSGWGNTQVYQKHLTQCLLSLCPGEVLLRRSKVRGWTSEVESFVYMKSLLHHGDR